MAAVAGRQTPAYVTAFKRVQNHAQRTSLYKMGCCVGRKRNGGGCRALPGVNMAGVVAGGGARQRRAAVQRRAAAGAARQHQRHRSVKKPNKRRRLRRTSRRQGARRVSGNRCQTGNEPRRRAEYSVPGGVTRATSKEPMLTWGLVTAGRGEPAAAGMLALLQKCRRR